MAFHEKNEMQENVSQFIHSQLISKKKTSFNEFKLSFHLIKKKKKAKRALSAY